MNNGPLCIVAMVDQAYLPYAPLFTYCAEKAYPDAGIKVFIRGPIPKVPQFEDSIYWDFYEDSIFNRWSKGKGATSSLRFLVPESRLMNDYSEMYDYYFFTDIDMLMFPEPRGIIEPHVAIMREEGLMCYENISMPHFKYGRRMPGVHFVTKAWFSHTLEERKKWRDILEEEGAADYYEHDEVMLHKITVDSKLPICEKGHENWRWHGHHLGKYRVKGKRGRIGKIKLTKQAEVDFYKELFEDEEFCSLLKYSSGQSWEIRTIFQKIRQIVL